MGNCIDTIPIENLDSCPSDETVAGIMEVGVYGAPVRDFVSIEKPSSFETALDNEGLATIVAAHIFKLDKGFHKLDFIPFTGMVESVQIGEAGNLSFQNSIAGQIKGTNARVAGYFRRYKNEAMIYVVKEKNGDIKQLGSELSPAYITEVAATSGAKAGDLKSTTVKILDSQSYMAPNYGGAIQEWPAPAPV